MSYFNILAQKLAQDINIKKEKIIQDKIKELKLDFDPEEEAEKRFKKLSVEQTEDSETYWFDNGTKHGLRIVTFSMKKQTLTSGASMSVIVELEYS